MELRARGWRNTLGALSLYLGIILLSFLAPDASIKEAHILCQGSGKAVAVLPDMSSCIAKAGAVPKWRDCACYRPGNDWSTLYWQCAVPSFIVLVYWLLLRLPPVKRAIHIKAVLLASATYSVTAVGAFGLIFSPFAGINQLPIVLVYSAIVLLPYLVLIAAYRIAIDPPSEITVAVSTIMAAIIGGFLYIGSFGHADGEYVLIYMLVPIIQAPFVMGALGMAVWRQRKRETHQGR